MGNPVAWGAAVFLLSVLLHGAAWWCLSEWQVAAPLSRDESNPAVKKDVLQKPSVALEDMLSKMSEPEKVVVIPLEEEEPEPVARQEKPEPPPFLKTSEDQRSSRKPEDPVFMGDRDTVASGGMKPPDASALPMPTQDGRDAAEELVLFDQERQDGDVESEGRRGSSGAAAPVLPSVPVPHPDAAEVKQRMSSPMNAPHSASAAVPPGRGVREGVEDGVLGAKGQDAEDQPIPAGEDVPDDGLGDAIASVLKDADPTLPKMQEARPLLGMEDAPVRQGGAAVSAPRLPKPVVYDPSLPMSAQPGFRSYERRTMSRGNFVFGSRPSMDVASTPLGRYEALIYRRIAARWYPLTDSHRGDMKPGSLMLRLLVNEKGYVVSLELERRVGAGAVQQSITYRAIRQAELPPMPPEVRDAIVGDVLELRFTFNFD